MRKDGGGVSAIDLGGTFSESIRLTIRMLGRIFLYSLFLGTPGAVVGFWAGLTAESADDSGRVIAIQLVLQLVAGLLGVYFLAVVTVDASGRLSGTPRSIGACLAAGARAFPRLLGLLFVIYLAMIVTIAVPFGILAGLTALSDAFGLFALVLIPAVMVGSMALVCVYFVTIPVCVLEAKILSSLRRSRELTGGSRWIVLALVCLLGAVSMGVYAVSGFALVASMGFGSFGQIGNPPSFSSPGIIVGLVVYCAGLFIVSALSTVMPTVVHHRLRVLKEGGGRDALAEVFE